MDSQVLIEGFAMYLCMVLIVTVHEYGHAWMSSRCGDDTARDQGRVTLNPIAHMDPIGTVAIPLLMLFLSASGQGRIAGLMLGWGKPVPVNLSNLRHRVRDEILIAMAGPAMNVVMMLAALVVARIALGFNVDSVVEAGVRMASLSMYLFFFNLIPVPPLDGSRVARHIIGLKEETFHAISRYGFFIVIVLIQIPAVTRALTYLTLYSVDVVWEGLKRIGAGGGM